MARIPSRFALLLTVAVALTGCQRPGELTTSEQAVIGGFLRNAASASQNDHDYTAAMSYYQSLHTRDPHDIDAAVGLARNLRYSGAPAEAVRVLQRAVKDNPDAGALRSELGKAMLATGRVDEAMAVLRSAIAATPDDWQAMVGLGIAHDIRGQWAEAQRNYHAALRLSPDNPTILNNLALSKALSGDLEAGIAILKRAAMLPDAGPQTRQNLALMYATRGDMVMAERLIQRDLPASMVEQNLAYYRELQPMFANAGDPGASEPVSYEVAMLVPADQNVVIVAVGDGDADEIHVAIAEGGEAEADEIGMAAIAIGVNESVVADAVPDGQAAIPDSTFAMVAPDEDEMPPEDDLMMLEDDQMVEPDPMFAFEPEPDPMAPSDFGGPVDLFAEAGPDNETEVGGDGVDLSWLDTLMSPAASGDEADGRAVQEVQLQLGAFETQLGAAKWLGDIHDSHIELLWGLRFEIAGADVNGGGYHLIAGPMDDPILASELCDQFNSLDAECTLIAN